MKRTRWDPLASHPESQEQPVEGCRQGLGSSLWEPAGSSPGRTAADCSPEIRVFPPFSGVGFQSWLLSRE